MLDIPLANTGWWLSFGDSLFYAHFAVAGGLVVESLAFKIWLRWSWKRALLAALVVNAISCGLGVVLIPVLDMSVAPSVETLLSILLPMEYAIYERSMNLAVLWFLAAVLSLVLEYWPLVFLFKAKGWWRPLWVLFVANFVSAGLAYWVMMFASKMRAAGGVP